jgi:hypothetical protein
MRMGTASPSEDGREPHKHSLTPEEAGRRIAVLRRVYDEGYITGATLEALTRNTRAQVKRNR